MTTRKIALRVLALALMGTGIFVVLRSDASDSQQANRQQHEEARVLPVETLPLKEVAGYSRQRHYTGLLKESRRSRLSFQRGGEVKELLVDEGDAVYAGQLLARLDSRHIDARRAELEAQISEAEAVLAELEAGPRRETIAAKRAEHQAQVARRDSLAKQVDRRAQLLGTTAVSREEYETFQFDLAAAEAQAERLESELAELLAGTRTEQLAAQRSRLAQLRAALVDVDHDLEDTVIKAPYDGRIGARSIDEGTVVNPGTVVFELLDDKNLEAWIGLPVTASAKQFAVGDRCSVEVAGQRVDAVVQSLAAEVDTTTRTRMVRFCLEAEPGRVVLPGQVGRLEVAEEVHASGFWVPTTALARGARGLWSVYVVQEDLDSGCHQVVARDVELLETEGDRSFVRGTLVSGDQVVTQGTHRVVNGQQVAVHQGRLAATR